MRVSLRGLGACTFDGNEYTDENAMPCDPAGTGSGSGTAVSSSLPGGETYTTPSDNVYITGCKNYDAAGNCVQCNPGLLLDNAGGTTGCVAASGTAAAASSGTSFLDSLLKSIGVTPAPVAGSAAAKTPTAGNVQIAGMSVSPMALLLGAGVILLLTKKR